MRAWVKQTERTATAFPRANLNVPVRTSSTACHFPARLRAERGAQRPFRTWIGPAWLLGVAALALLKLAPSGTSAQRQGQMIGGFFANLPAASIWKVELELSADQVVALRSNLANTGAPKSGSTESSSMMLQCA